MDKHRLVLTAGNLSVIDLFGLDEYAGDARTQFLNWWFLTYGAFDYAADLRGYARYSLRLGMIAGMKLPKEYRMSTLVIEHLNSAVEALRIERFDPGG